jgi:hypothetical protein
LIYRPEDEVLAELEKFKSHVVSCASKPWHGRQTNKLVWWWESAWSASLSYGFSCILFSLRRLIAIRGDECLCICFIRVCSFLEMRLSSWRFGHMLCPFQVKVALNLTLDKIKVDRFWI